jgi:hypothetical protein
VVFGDFGAWLEFFRAVSGTSVRKFKINPDAGTPGGRISKGIRKKDQVFLLEAAGQPVGSQDRFLTPLPEM